jgi:hypothetical protein
MEKVKEDVFNEDIDTQKLVSSTKEMYKRLNPTCERLVKFSGELWDIYYEKFNLALEEFCHETEKEFSDPIFSDSDVSQIGKDIRDSIMGISKEIKAMLEGWNESAIKFINSMQASEGRSIPRVKEIGLDLVMFVKPIAMDAIPWSGVGIKIINYLSMVDVEEMFATRVSDPIRRERCRDILAHSIFQLHMTVWYVNFNTALTKAVIEFLQAMGRLPISKTAMKVKKTNRKGKKAQRKRKK